MEINYSDIPLWLQDSHFFCSLDADEPESRISIPIECFSCAEDSVSSVDDLVHILQVMRFWGVKCIPLSVLQFCYDNDIATWGGAVADIAIPEVRTLREVFKMPGDVALEVALRTDRAEVLTFWLTNHNRSSKFSERAIVQACRFGRLDLVQTFHKQRYPLNGYAFCAAAQYGHVHVLKYLIENGFPWDYRAIKYAVRGGQVECVKLLHTHARLWDQSATLEFAVPKHYASITASERSFWNDNWTILPPAGGYLECLQYALENDCTIHSETWERASSYGLVDCLQLLHLYNIPFSGAAKSAAARAGQLHCLQYLHDIGCPWCINAPDYAAQNGHLDCLRFILKNGGSYQEKHLLQSAASSGNGVGCLKYLVEERHFSVRKDESVTAVPFNLAANRRKNTIKSEDSLFGAAFNRADFASVEYLISVGCPFENFVFQKPSFDLFDGSRDAAFLQCIQYAVVHGWKYNIELLDYIVWRNNCTEHSRHLPLCRAFVDEVRRSSQSLDI